MQPQRIARIDGSQPAQVLGAEPDRTVRSKNAAVDHQPHAVRRRLPATRDDSPEAGARRFGGTVKNLRIVLEECRYRLLGDRQRARFKTLAEDEVFEIPLHRGSLASQRFEFLR